MIIEYTANGEPIALKCDDCGKEVPMKYGTQTVPWQEQIRVWDDDTDLCPACFKKREEEEEAQ